MSEQIRDHGEIVTAPAGTTEEQVIASLAGTDKVPSLEELGRAKAPPFDPHAGHEVAPGREFGGEPEPMISTLVFIGVDRGGDFEDSIQALVATAERLGLNYVTATVGKFDIQQHGDDVAEMWAVVDPDDDEDDEPLDGNEADYGEPI